MIYLYRAASSKPRIDTYRSEINQASWASNFMPVPLSIESPAAAVFPRHISRQLIPLAAANPFDAASRDVVPLHFRSDFTAGFHVSPGERARARARARPDTHKRVHGS